MTADTFDERRSVLRVCACGRHLVTGGDPQRPGCVWHLEVVSLRYGVIVVQADRQEGVE